MPEDQSSKTEQPTNRKLEQAREKGQVPKSKDIPMVLIFIWAAAFLAVMWQPIITMMLAYIQETGNLYTYSFIDAVNIFISAGNVLFTKIIIPFVLGAALIAIIGNVSQFGFLISFESITPKGSKIDPVAGFKRLFGMQSIVTLLLNLLKMLTILLIAYLMIIATIRYVLVDINTCKLDCLQFINRLIYWTMAKYLILMFSIIAVLDYIKEKQFFTKQQMMSKQDIKRESKDSNGDPQIKQRRREMGREFEGSSVKEIISETRILVKDVGVCAALKFIQGETPLPIILALGKKKNAEQMESVAREEKVKVVKSPKLMAILLEEGEVNQYIPESAIAEAAKVIM